MKNFLITIVGLLISINTYSEIPHWKLSEVKGNDRSVVGYVYHTEAVGTQVSQKTEKVVAGLRLVCSTKASTQRNNDLIIAIYWDGMFGNLTQSTDVLFNKRMFETGQKLRWDQDGPLLIRYVTDSRTFIQALKVNKDVKISWIGTDNVKRIVMFDLQEFNMNISEFAKLCKADV